MSECAKLYHGARHGSGMPLRVITAVTLCILASVTLSGKQEFTSLATPKLSPPE